MISKTKLFYLRKEDLLRRIRKQIDLCDAVLYKNSNYYFEFTGNIRWAFNNRPKNIDDFYIWRDVVKELIFQRKELLEKRLFKVKFTYGAGEVQYSENYLDAYKKYKEKSIEVHKRK